MMPPSSKILVHATSLSCRVILSIWCWTMSKVNCQGRGTLLFNSSCFLEGKCFPEHTASCPDWWAWDGKMGGPLLGPFLSNPLLGARLSYTLFLASLLEKFSGDNINTNFCGCPLCLQLGDFVLFWGFLLGSPLLPHTKGIFSSPAILCWRYYFDFHFPSPCLFHSWFSIWYGHLKISILPLQWNHKHKSE